MEGVNTGGAWYMRKCCTIFVTFYKSKIISKLKVIKSCVYI